MMRILLGFILILMPLILVSCSKDSIEDEKTGNEEVFVTSTLSVNTSSINLGKKASTVYISVTSNTKWTVYVDNTVHGPGIGLVGSGITGLNVSPLSGEGDGTVKVEYGSVETTYYDESATIYFYYYTNGVKQTKTVRVGRKVQ